MVLITNYIAWFPCFWDTVTHHYDNCNGILSKQCSSFLYDFAVYYLLWLMRIMINKHDNHKPYGYHMKLLACGFCQLLFPSHPPVLQFKKYFTETLWKHMNLQRKQSLLVVWNKSCAHCTLITEAWYKVWSNDPQFCEHFFISFEPVCQIRRVHQRYVYA